MILKMSLAKKTCGDWQMIGLCTIAVLAVSGCHREPPSERAAVTLPVYHPELVEQGRVAYQNDCEQCHTIRPGSNHKAPQLMRVYGAPAAELKDYQYTDAMQAKAQQGWHWTAQNLDRYIADPHAAIPDTRMESEKITDPAERQAIIAYVSTLR